MNTNIASNESLCKKTTDSFSYHTIKFVYLRRVLSSGPLFLISCHKDRKYSTSFAPWKQYELDFITSSQNLVWNLGLVSLLHSRKKQFVSAKKQIWTTTIVILMWHIHLQCKIVLSELHVMHYSSFGENMTKIHVSLLQLCLTALKERQVFEANKQSSAFNIFIEIKFEINK